MTQTFAIDITTWSKAVAGKPIGTGYEARPKNRRPSSIIIHATHGNRGTRFENEAKFLRDSILVGCAYLVGKLGQIVEIVPPDQFVAWQAGQTKAGFSNLDSIGIELHHALGEEYTPLQMAALTDLTRSLMAQYDIPLERVETHRFVALPNGRKSDPGDWDDLHFYEWRRELAAKPYVVSVAANVRSLRTTAAQILRVADAGEVVWVRDMATGQALKGLSQWYGLVGGGYIHGSLLQPVEPR